MAGLVMDTQHSANITDIACNSTGRFLATASEDGTIRISEVSAPNSSDGSPSPKAPEPLDALIAHKGAITKVVWGHYLLSGNPLLSCGIDGAVHVWRDVQQNKKWVQTYTSHFQSPVLCGAWAPHECGLTMFAVSCANGQIVVHTETGQGEWDKSVIDAHTNGGGCNAVCFSPGLPPSALLSLPLQPSPPGTKEPPPPFPRIVSCGNERSVRIWRYVVQDRQWLQEHELNDISSSSVIVNDVAWAPNYGLPFGYIAAASEDGVVAVWLQDGFDGKWKVSILPTFSSPACRVSWSMIGTFLSISCADGPVTLWKEDKRGEWVNVGTVDPPGS